jgi:hypothetical protein
MLRAMFPQAAFLPKERSIHATVNLRSLKIVSEVDALIDSGTTENFISPAVIEHFSIPTRPLGKPIDIRNVDGTVNKKGKVTRGVHRTRTSRAGQFRTTVAVPVPYSGHLNNLNRRWTGWSRPVQDRQSTTVTAV